MGPGVQKFGVRAWAQAGLGLGRDAARGRRDSAPSSASGTSQSKSLRSGGPSPSESSGRSISVAALALLELLLVQVQMLMAGVDGGGALQAGWRRAASGVVAPEADSSIAGCCAAAGAGRTHSHQLHVGPPRRLRAHASASANIPFALLDARPGVPQVR